MIISCPCGSIHRLPDIVLMIRCLDCAKIHCTVCKSIHNQPCNCKDQHEKSSVMKSERLSILPGENRNQQLNPNFNGIIHKVEVSFMRTEKRRRGTDQDEFPVVKKERQSRHTILPVVADSKRKFCSSCRKSYRNRYFPEHLKTKLHLNTVKDKNGDARRGRSSIVFD